MLIKAAKADKAGPRVWICKGAKDRPKLCIVCMLSFSTTPSLGCHEQATGHGGRGLPPVPTTRVDRRQRFTFRQKRDYLQSVRCVAECQCGGDMHHARKIVEARTGVKVNRLWEWERKSDTIFRYARTRRLGGSKAVGYPSPKWPEAEDELKHSTREPEECGITIVNNWRIGLTAHPILLELLTEVPTSIIGLFFGYDCRYSSPW
jgi:hypothetical protein